MIGGCLYPRAMAQALSLLQGLGWEGAVAGHQTVSPPRGARDLLRRGLGQSGLLGYQETGPALAVPEAARDPDPQAPSVVL